jgi:hypothetical protein
MFAAAFLNSIIHNFHHVQCECADKLFSSRLILLYLFLGLKKNIEILVCFVSVVVIRLCPDQAFLASPSTGPSRRNSSAPSLPLPPPPTAAAPRAGFPPIISILCGIKLIRPTHSAYIKTPPQRTYFGFWGRWEGVFCLLSLYSRNESITF